MALNAAFFDAVRLSLFGKKLTEGQVRGMEAIAEAWSRSGDGDDRKLAYLLATAKHETANTMAPIYERGAKSYFDKYEPGTKLGKALGNTIVGDGYRFRGTGLVQLTGRANFRKAGQKIGVDLIKEPEKAAQLEVAAIILVKGCMEGWFTGKKLGDYINAAKTDYINARRVVNGTDKASLIAGYADKFEEALVSAGKSPAVPSPPTPSPAPASPQRKTLMDLVRGWFVQKATEQVVSTMKDHNMLNSNLLHNILNVAIALLAGVTAFLLATGCTQLVTGALDCSASWIDPVWTTGITAALGLLKTGINIVRDGFGGLFKQQPPVR